MGSQSAPRHPMKKNNPSKKRIVIVDDHPMMREGLAQLIEHEPDLTVSSQADTAAQALQVITLEALVVSMHDEALYAERVLRAGGRGYIMKQEGGKKLMQAIRQVLSGRIYVSEKMSAKILETFSGRRGDSQSRLENLSDREFEVFQLLGQGQGTRQIAEHLHISVKTVEVHRANVRKKLEL